MSVIKLEINSKVFYNEIEHIIKGYPSFNEVLLKRSIKPYTEKVVKVAELIKDPKNSKEQDRAFVEIEDEQFAEALKKYKIIEPLTKLKNRTADDVKRVAKEHKKSIATLYRWLNTYETYGTVSSLASKRYNSGAKGRSRLDESVLAIVDSVLDELFLNKQKYPLQTIYDQIVEKCHNADLKPPSKNTIRNRINTIHPKMIAKYRHKMSVRETRGMPGKFPEVKMPLDMIQIDHTKVDITLVDENTREAIGRPYITVAIDLFSRMVYGFYISLQAPSYFSVGQCLLNAILPKDDFLKKYEIQGEWPVFGLPKTVHMDNAREFRSESLHNFCQEFQITDIYRPVGRSHLGGHVERAIKTYMKQVHQLPGSTFSNIDDKGYYDSEKEAAMTINEFEKWFLDFIVNIYHKTEHSALGMTPEEKFYESYLGVNDKSIPFLPNVPADTLKLRMALLPQVKRAVQKNGITIDYITYFSERLRKWIIPPQYKKLKPDIDNTVLCKRDPRDISKIYVYDEDIKDYITVPYADIKRPAMNLQELKDAIAQAKQKVSGRELEPYDVFEAHERLKSYVENATRLKKSARRKASSKKHMEKTLTMEKENISYKEPVKKEEYIKSDFKEDDEDGYEYYPIG